MVQRNKNQTVLPLVARRESEPNKSHTAPSVTPPGMAKEYSGFKAGSLWRGSNLRFSRRPFRCPGNLRNRALFEGITKFFGIPMGYSRRLQIQAPPKRSSFGSRACFRYSWGSHREWWDGSYFVPTQDEPQAEGLSVFCFAVPHKWAQHVGVWFSEAWQAFALCGGCLIWWERSRALNTRTRICLDGARWILGAIPPYGGRRVPGTQAQVTPVQTILAWSTPCCGVSTTSECVARDDFQSQVTGSS